ncbi:MAG TPA: pirin family protein [Puia sp.]|nr:pirin family protein [Puia sp.]
MSTTLHKADTRGHADHGWLNSFFSFSFAGYYNPQRVQFGVLRVLNDDRVAGGRGFGSHPHDNMEIISIPLEGSLAHEDNLGHKEIVSAGEVQVMSTGKGVFHSEYNNSPDQPVEFLQIWVFPNKLNVTPRYDQVRLDPRKGHNALQQLIYPYPGPAGSTTALAGTTTAPTGTTTTPTGSTTAPAGGSWIYQDAWFHMGTFDAGRKIGYQLKKPGNGIYLFVIDGAFLYNGQRLETRDALGITDVDSIDIEAAEQGSRILIMDVPMKNNIQ